LTTIVKILTSDATLFLCVTSALGLAILTTAATPDRPANANQAERATLATSRSQQRDLGDINEYVDNYFWRIFEKPPEVDAFVTECPGCFYMFNVTVGIAVPPPWTFATQSCALVTIVEQYGPNMQYELFDNNVTLGNTSVPVEEGGPCANDPMECIRNGASQGTFLLSAGNHSLTIKGLGRYTDYGVFRIDTVGCPSAPTRAPTTPSTRASTRPTRCTPRGKGGKGGKGGMGGKGGKGGQEGKCSGKGGKGKRGKGKEGKGKGGTRNARL
jgi:hypothetical protein